MNLNPHIPIILLIILALTLALQACTAVDYSSVLKSYEEKRNPELYKLGFNPW
jgi:hypothetical protein